MINDLAEAQVGVYFVLRAGIRALSTVVWSFELVSFFAKEVEVGREGVIIFINWSIEMPRARE
jgi:hypothetical protein